MNRQDTTLKEEVFNWILPRRRRKKKKKTEENQKW